jgi:PAS domain S-box-containing protein
MKAHNQVIKGKIKKPSNPVEDSLKYSELSYRRLFETAQIGILIIDAGTGRIIDVNPFLIDLLGYSRKDFIDKSLWDIGRFKDIRISKSAYKDLMRNGFLRYEHLPLKTKDGRHIEVEFVSNVYQAGQKRMIQCNIRDISQRKAHEKSQIRIESQLKQAQKMATVAALAGGIAHQFNNALTEITSSLKVLEIKGKYQELVECLQLMEKAANRMSRLTLKLLAYARGGKYSIEAIFLSDLVRDSLLLLKPRLKPQVAIDTDISPDLLPINANRDQMLLVLQAILTNALEAIETQGLIRITGHKEEMTEKRVKHFPGMTPGIYTTLTVKDNGKGMEKEACSRVFEPFFTAHFPGRGLGMAAVYRIVKNHDGWISVESQLGKGTLVKIQLPAFFESNIRTIAKQKPNPLQASSAGIS